MLRYAAFIDKKKTSLGWTYGPGRSLVYKHRRLSEPYRAVRTEKLDIPAGFSGYSDLSHHKVIPSPSSLLISTLVYYTVCVCVFVFSINTLCVPAQRSVVWGRISISLGKKKKKKKWNRFNAIFFILFSRL